MKIVKHLLLQVGETEIDLSKQDLYILQKKFLQGQLSDRDRELLDAILSALRKQLVT